jgi:peptide/nickel transport system substrate-binding protein
MVVALVVAACGSTLPPIPTSAPTQSEPPTTPIPSTGRFVPAAYPVKADAPCGQAKPPDASHAAYAGEIKRITAKDQYTVVFELCRPDVAFLAKIAWPAFAINDSGWLRANIAAAGKGAQAIVTNVNGTGPYRLEDWRHGSEISLARNDAYWGATPANERLIVRWTADGAARVTDLQNGTVDGIDDLDPSAFATVTDDVSLALMPRPGMNIFYMGFNDTVAPFDNEKVRQAIDYAIPRDQIVADIYRGLAVKWEGVMPSVYPGYVEFSAFKTDIAKSKQLMQEAGAGAGFPITLAYSAGDPVQENIGILMKSTLAQLNIAVELRKLPVAAHSDLVQSKKADFALWIDFPIQPDPNYSLRLLYLTGNAVNYQNYHDPEVDRILQEGASIVDTAERNAAHKPAEERIHDSATLGWIAEPFYVNAMSDKLEGWKWFTTQYYKVSEMKLP